MTRPQAEPRWAPVVRIINFLLNAAFGTFHITYTQVAHIVLQNRLQPVPPLQRGAPAKIFDRLVRLYNGVLHHIRRRRFHAQIGFQFCFRQQQQIASLSIQETVDGFRVALPSFLQTLLQER